MQVHWNETEGNVRLYDGMIYLPDLSCIFSLLLLHKGYYRNIGWIFFLLKYTYTPSTTTATPAGCTAFVTATAICLVRRS